MGQYFSAMLSLLELALIFWGGYAGAQSLGQTAKADNSSTAKIERGKRIYISYGCYQCHGREGQGAPATGSRVGPDPISLPAFIRYIRQPTGQMPPYTNRVTADSELSEIYAFLQALPPPAKSLPLGP